MKNLIKNIFDILIYAAVTYCICGIFLQFLNLKQGVIGATFKKNAKNEVCVVKIRKDFPAFKSGLSVGDCIVHINDEPMQGRTPHYVASRVMGEPNTSVK